MELQRSSGVLLHVGSLPGRYGVGDLGPGAYRFVDWLADAGQKWWQILPAGPPGDGGCPYSALSSWAGGSAYLSLELLEKGGDISVEDLEEQREKESNRLLYDKVLRRRRRLYRKAAETFFTRGRKKEREAYTTFCRTHGRTWLNDWALFAVCKQQFGKKRWWEWPQPLREREPKALREFIAQHRRALEEEQYLQFRFFEQWKALREYAAKKGVGIIGDIPIYCAADSADVWAAPELFQLNTNGSPKKVAGVPPDYFSATGQLWGMPLYNWKAHKKSNYRWWVSRLKMALTLADIVRIDHFRAFEAYWEVSARAKTAKGGRWVKGPGDDFFRAIRRKLGKAPFIAEDLGVITPPVCALRDRWSLPGMRVLQFAFDGSPENIHLPWWHVPHSITYTGTHDNNTTRGWYSSAGAKEKERYRKITGATAKDCHWRMIELAWSSVSKVAIVPVQDVLGMGAAARMNNPGAKRGNWRWKLKSLDLFSKPEAKEKLFTLTKRYSR